MVKKLISASLFCLLGLLSAGLVLLIARPPHGAPIMLLPTDTEENVVVYVTGAVESPGVYTLPPASRVEAVIAAAGGFATDASTTSVNLAATIHDGQSIHVPSSNEQPAPSLPAVDQQGIINSTGLIDINTATIEELEQLPGIGPTKAEAIVQFRDSNGSFRSTDDLLLVPGIGESTLSQILPYITIDP